MTNISYIIFEHQLEFQNSMIEEKICLGSENDEMDVDTDFLFKR